MPELPEVESVVRALRPLLVGRRLGKSVVRWSRTLGPQSSSTFTRGLYGARVRSVERRAKWIVVALERDGRPAGALCVHLRMTGWLRTDLRTEAPGAWERLRIPLEDGRVLRFVDPRKFGRALFVQDPATLLGKLGPEPLEPEFTTAWLTQALRARRRIVKPLLLDQTFLAGLGNIYVDEALHRARVHPLARSERLQPQQVHALRGAIRAVLARALERQHDSDDDFKVYGREGESCPRCGTPIRRIVVGQRSTHLCPKCQPRPRAVTRSR